VPVSPLTTLSFAGYVLLHEPDIFLNFLNTVRLACRTHTENFAKPVLKNYSDNFINLMLMLPFMYLLFVHLLKLYKMRRHGV